MSESGVVAVTGASGFVGEHVVRDLAAAGYRIVAVSRAALAPATSAVEVRRVTGYDHPQTLAEALRGAEAVVHLAGRAHVLRERAADPEAEFLRANTDATRAVLAGAHAAGVRHFVLMSSIAALATRSDVRLDERSAPAPDTPYGRSKLAAERVVQDGSRDMVGTVLRPPLVYGPGMKGNPLRLWSLIARGVPLPVGSIDNRRSFLYVGNLTSAIVAALGAGARARGTFLLADAETVSTRELARRIGHSLDRPARLVSVPLPLLRLLAAPGDRLPRVPFDRDALDRLAGSLALDAAAFGRATGWRAPFSLDEGIARTSAWFRRAHAR